MSYNPYMGILRGVVIDSSTPSNLTYLWNFGSLLGLSLVVQIVTGIFLAMHYTAEINLAFLSVEHIQRDVLNGWLLRYTHANGAAFFFLFVYIHMGRGLYYGSYMGPRSTVWTVGVIIFFMMVATAFIGYVLPFSQMSYWAATVITNLMSAIPWIGPSLVELKIINKAQEGDLEPIGTKNIHAKKKVGKTIDYKSISPSFIAFLVGLIDGDGYIQVTRTKKGYITMKLVISLHLKDKATIEYIKSVLLLGKISIYKDQKSQKCTLIINKTDLQEVFFPLLIYHNIHFLTNNRRAQFNKAMFALARDIKEYVQYPLDSHIPEIQLLPTTVMDYAKLPYFNNWIVGFTVAEGSFHIKANMDGCFSLVQISHPLLFEAIGYSLLGTPKKIHESRYCRLVISSKRDIQSVINWFSFSGLHPLVGLKNIQYLNWLDKLKKSKRYGNLKFPDCVI